MSATEARRRAVARRNLRTAQRISVVPSISLSESPEPDEDLDRFALDVGLSEDAALERAIDLALAEAGKPGTNFTQVGPAARKKLSGLMKFYAKKPHPFAACVRDNAERFGQDRAERICAVLKDLIRGTTKWRAGGKADHGTAGLKMAETHEDAPDLDEEVASVLATIGDDTRKRLVAALDGAVELAEIGFAESPHAAWMKPVGDIGKGQVFLHDGQPMVVQDHTDGQTEARHYGSRQRAHLSSDTVVEPHGQAAGLPPHAEIVDAAYSAARSALNEHEAVYDYPEQAVPAGVAVVVDQLAAEHGTLPRRVINAHVATKAVKREVSARFQRDEAKRFHSTAVAG